MQSILPILATFPGRVQTFFRQLANIYPKNKEKKLLLFYMHSLCFDYCMYMFAFMH